MHTLSAFTSASLILLLAACQTVDHTSSDLASHQGGTTSASSPGSPASPADPTLAAWTQLGPQNTLIARVVTTAGTCPALTIDDEPQPMTVRAGPSTAYPVLTCELDVPVTAQHLLLAGKTLPLPKAAPKVIAVIGDTGCEIKAGSKKVAVQDCNNPAAWPLAQVAATLAGMHPDLIVHVGDYHYRETDCPAKKQAQCGGAQIGDTWPSWNQDFFSPAAPLLAAAPLLLIRGNHELCSRAGTGWFQFLDPRPWQSCTDTTNPYWTTVGTHQVAVIDAASDSNMQPSFAQLQPDRSTPIWWMLHRPFLTPAADDELTGTAPTLPAAWQAAGALQMVLTGHKHLMSLSKFSNGLPPELISGNGGTSLEKRPTSGHDVVLAEAAPASTLEYYDYGFLLFKDQGSGHWQVDEYNRSGNVVAACTLTETLGAQTSLTCKAAASGITL